MTPADRDRIEQLLQDPSLSCRAIARETGFSDWTIRKIARQLDGDPRPMRSHTSVNAEDGSAVAGWLAIGGVAAFFALLIWASSRWTPPQSCD